MSNILQFSSPQLLIAQNAMSIAFPSVQGIDVVKRIGNSEMAKEEEE